MQAQADFEPRCVFAVIMSVGWYRLVRARRSQLFLRSALKQRKNEELSSRWGVGPVVPKSDPRAKASEGSGGNDKGRKGDRAAEDVMMKKDGSQL